MTATMAKLSAFTTGIEEVVWAHLHEADTKFGVPGNHNITLAFEGELKDTMEEILKSSGASKINGIYEEKTGEDKTATGRKMIKFKTSLHAKEGVSKFPCYDSNAVLCDEVVFGGDKAKLRLKPGVVSRDNSLSFYLNGVQIVEKNGSASGFDTVDGGFEGEMPTQMDPPKETTDPEHPFE